MRHFPLELGLTIAVEVANNYLGGHNSLLFVVKDVGLKQVSVIASCTKQTKTRGLFTWLTCLTGNLFIYVDVYLHMHNYTYT